MLLSRFFQKLHRKRESLNFRFKRTIYAPALWRWLLVNSRPMHLSQKSAIVFAPHQDDESLGCGGLIALKQEQNIPIQVVFLTDGRSSHPKHPFIKGEEMVRIRQQEAIDALQILSVQPSQIHFLSQLDGHLPKLSSSERQQMLTQLVQLLQTIRPEEVYVPYRKDVNADHIAAYELIHTALLASGIPAELIQYPVWSLWKPWVWDFSAPELKNAYRLPIIAMRDRKRQALEVYRSQYQPLPPETKPLLPPGFLDRFLSPYEIFFRPEANQK
ncbi:PIG-L family deacetylase [Trichocoleus sp. FACHB-591]|uniref:PIG-L deacetylase family protein n=1 Tax=Trichocoleus sp. FACHB-591 TaxID=2692872 RepID=UPI001681E703|nr:PIG-L family deacetylase [Trichocoleus sp. FACHB-591]MBD2095511.1 PIG-L family deacetylase [Trichocoleus sp. FACHB-591]